MIIFTVIKMVLAVYILASLISGIRRHDNQELKRAGIGFIAYIIIELFIGNIQ